MWFFLTLNNLNAVKADICPYCGTEIGVVDKWKLANDVVYHIHNNCIDKIVTKKECENGTYKRGFIGALIGALIATIPYTLVYLFLNVITFWIGFFIGFLTNKGYVKMNGKEGKFKIPILIFVSIISLVIIPFVGLIIYNFLLYKIDFSINNILNVINILFNNKEFTVAFCTDTAVALFIAILFIALMVSNKGIGVDVIKDLE